MATWIFQGNPDRFDVNRYLTEHDHIYWTVSRPVHQDRVAVGDTVFLWRAKGRSNLTPGVVGLGTIVEPCQSESKIADDESLGVDLWTDQNRDTDEIKAGINVNEIRLTEADGMLSLNELRQDPVLSQMQIITFRVGSNFPLTEEQAERLHQLWQESAISVEYPLESHSWRAISDTVAIKILDKSAFLHHGSGVPRDFKLFFGLSKLAPDQKIDITIVHKGTRFDAHFQMDKLLERMRLFWRSDFSELLQSSLPDWHQAFSQGTEMETDRPEMRFQKLTDSEYQIDFIRPAEIELDVDSEVAEEALTRSEGAAKYSYSKRYERDPVNRRKAIQIHGCTCCICGFDFELAYGDRGKGFIEIHHTKPLSELEGETFIDPATDLVPVCSNCHRMIHRRKDDVLSIVEMREIAIGSKE